MVRVGSKAGGGRKVDRLAAELGVGEGGKEKMFGGGGWITAQRSRREKKAT